ncbi:MAG: hypothetical protein QOH63_2609 [Acidobacteriota bacterium]|jgi:hypothetical protein|nr:hypothetical protein [Acidobacteriota bacterium]
MKKAIMPLICAAIVVLALAGTFITSTGGILANAHQAVSVPEPEPEPPVVATNGFEVEVLVNGYPLEEYAARGRHYVEALDGAEYELRIRNPLGQRVAVALSVDGMNSIDARRSSAWEASKWVIEPYQTITISGWQMSSSRARRFYFTTERDSYGAKLGQTANLGVISAVFFREREPVVIVQPPPPRPYEDDGIDRNESRNKSEAPSSNGREGAGAQSKSADAAPRPDDDYAATGIGRNVRNDVRWINLDLQSRPAGEVTIRYEYHDALVRLGIIPRPYPRPDTLRRRERSTGFEDRAYSPEP